MRRQSPATGAAPGVRLASWTACFATIALIALLGLARSAQAASPLPIGEPTHAKPSEPPEAEELAGEEGEEEELEAEECELAEEEGEECEEEAGASAEAPPACLLTSAQATVSASLASDRLRLVVRYTTSAPTAVALDYWLRGGKGPLSLPPQHKHLGSHGTLRQTETLTAAQMAKVQAAKDFTVQLRPLSAPHFCQRLFDRHLTARHASAGNLTWSDPEASASE
jgi:hypothetical protein